MDSLADSLRISCLAYENKTIGATIEDLPVNDNEKQKVEAKVDSTAAVISAEKAVTKPEDVKNIVDSGSKEEDDSKKVENLGDHPSDTTAKEPVETDEAAEAKEETTKE